MGWLVVQTKSRILFLGMRSMLPHMLDLKYIPACFRQASVANQGLKQKHMVH